MEDQTDVYELLLDGHATGKCSGGLTSAASTAASSIALSCTSWGVTFRSRPACLSARARLVHGTLTRRATDSCWWLLALGLACKVAVHSFGSWSMVNGHSLGMGSVLGDSVTF